MPVTRQGSTWWRTITLNRFQQRPHLVFDTDRPESAGGDVLETFRSSMTLDFLRQRFALTRISSPSWGVRLRSFRSLDTCTWAWRGRGGLERLAKLYRKYLLMGEEQGGDGIFDITLERRWLSTNCYDKPGRFTPISFFFLSFQSNLDSRVRKNDESSRSKFSSDCWKIILEFISPSVREG